VSRLHELHKKLASRGVEFKSLGDVGTFVRGSGLQKADLTDVGVPAIHYGQIHTHYGTWADSTKSFTDPALAAKLRRAKPGDLIIATTSEDDAAVAKATAWMGAGEVVVSGDAYIYHHLLDPRYVAYFFQSEQFRSQKRPHVTGAKVRRISGEAMSKIRIPVPPREMQEEVVRILDDFEQTTNALAAALSSESELRRSQLSHSREVQLNRAGSAAIEGSLALSEFVHFTNGKPHEQLVSANGTVALLTARFISTSGKSARFVREGDALTPALRGDIALVMSDLPNGRALARCFFVDNDSKYSANQRVCLLRVRDPKRISSRWLYHFLDRNPQLLAYDNGQDQTHLKKGQILDIRVPVIPLAEQEQAATTLDQLDASVRDLVFSLQAELASRRQQYEYYRDRLLTFKQVVA
jgi:type I restriction enzyme S subunit